MWYRACNRTRDGRFCRKKVTESDSNPGSFNCRCGERNLSESETEMRYMVNMNIMDVTSSVWAVMFDGGSLFKMTAQELFDVKRKNERQFEEKIAEALWTLTNFSVTAKVETFNGSPKLKFTVHFAERVWEEEESYKKHMKKRWMEIAALERELGVSHEEEFGIAINGEAAFENFNP